jgi:hypothetical protein
MHKILSCIGFGFFSNFFPRPNSTKNSWKNTNCGGCCGRFLNFLLNNLFLKFKRNPIFRLYICTSVIGSFFGCFRRFFINFHGFWRTSENNVSGVKFCREFEMRIEPKNNSVWHQSTQSRLAVARSRILSTELKMFHQRCEFFLQVAFSTLFPLSRVAISPD